eukprot:TRINITY_DN8309_c0_g1_i1.p1 TRINITY_DN8309_c0_g1~~TRINITY_DN8309_c0_g1_i1.p1  ORF type:complete len:391 (+),score=85.76 TRINITY_DN8309_c0_g1_i1:157-1173(+)
MPQFYGMNNKNTPLSSTGEQQADQIGQYFANIAISKIYSSPFRRCIQTAAPTARVSGKQINCENGIIEWLYGKLPLIPGYMDVVIKGMNIDGELSQYLELKPESEPIMTIYIVRHGHRLDYENKEWHQMPQFYGMNNKNTPLSSTGEQQADQIGQYFANIAISKIYSSPFRRCIQTAAPTARVSGKQINCENGIIEWLYGKLPLIPGYMDVVSDYPIKVDGESLYDPEKIPEFVDVLYKRTFQFVQVFENEQKKGTFVLFTHAATVIALIHSFLRSLEKQFEIAVGSVSKLVKYEVDGAWVLETLNSCDHLDTGAQWAWGFDRLKEGMVYNATQDIFD